MGWRKTKESDYQTMIGKSDIANARSVPLDLALPLQITYEDASSSVTEITPYCASTFIDYHQVNVGDIN